MLLPLGLQIKIVLFSLLAGVLIGIFFDVYRIFRGFKVPKILVAFEDILFWILCAIMIFIFLLYANYAFLSIYVYFFMFIGDIIYLRLVSPYFMKVQNKVGRGIFKVIRVIFKDIAYVFKTAFLNESKKK